MCFFEHHFLVEYLLLNLCKKIKIKNNIKKKYLYSMVMDFIIEIYIVP